MVMIPNGHHFADNIFKCISVNEKFWILNKIKLKHVPLGPIYNMAALVRRQAIIWSNDDMFYWCIYVSLGLNDWTF